MAEEETKDDPSAEEALGAAGAAGGDGAGVETHDAQLPEAHGAASAHSGQIDILLGTSMPVEVRLGDVDMEVRDLLQIGPGAIIAMDKHIGDPLDLYLKGVKFANGQLIVSGETLGVRITKILPRRSSDRKESAESAEAPTDAPAEAPAE